MYSLQHKLPRLPVPSLEATVSKYLKTLLPLLTAAEHAATTKTAEEFLADPKQGPLLQQRLVVRGFHCAGASPHARGS